MLRISILKNKPQLLALLLIFTGTVLYGKTITNTLTIGGSVFTIDNSQLTVSEGIISAGYRRVINPDKFGFYYGADFSVGIPFTLVFQDSDQTLTAPPGNDLFIGFKIPFGYRWSGNGHTMGFFLGGGPTIQLISEWDQNTIHGLGIFGELGWQTNKTSGTGFYLGIQAGYSPLIFTHSSGTLNKVFGADISIHMGISWRREKNILSH